jgi:Predicted integral membrane protein
MRYCPNCGAEVRQEANFCPSCGYHLEQQTRPAVGPQTESENNKPMYQPKVEEPLKLELEKVDGLSITRAEIKKEAQEKLSGRYGEWCKTIILLIGANFVASLIFQIAYVRFFTNGLLRIFSPYDYYYDSYGYGYNYDYIQPYSSRFSLFAWFLIMVASFILIFLIAALSTAVLQWCAIHTLRGNRADGVQIFAYFIKAQKNRVLKANVLIAVYTFFWSLLFVIPGIVKSASYAMTNYLLEKDDNLNASDAILLSRQIMHGYKLEFLILRFSFFFWNLTAIFQLTNFYVMPYQNVTEILFLDMLYEHYIEQNKERIEE